MTDNFPKMLQPSDVFVTEGYPKHTYVAIDDGKKEIELREGLEQKFKIISISGPSKSGKSTLCDEVFGVSKGADRLYVTGESLRNDESLWLEAYNQVKDSTTPEFYTMSHGERVEFLLSTGLPLIIDDYHFIPKELQAITSKQIKNAAAQGLRIVCLSVPHRNDDPIRNNPDLAGRCFSVKYDFWSPEDLLQIPTKGFPMVGFPNRPEFNKLLTVEALQSPQIMQTLCLEACRMHGKDRALEHVVPEPGHLPEIIQRSLRSYDLATSYDILKNGPAKRGKDRTKFKTKNGKDLDVYECILEGIKCDPPFNHLTLDQIRDRVREILVDGSDDPGIRTSLQQYPTMFENKKPPLDWDDEKRRLTVNDPHFYFYLRHSSH